MKTKLSFKEIIAIASMLFGMFFGAGNLIFPVHMGQLAGSNVWPATIGFIVTGVGIPILAVAALAITRSNGLMELADHVGHGYSLFFTCLLYLTIGPFFAIPRCATVPFSMGLESLAGDKAQLALFIFTLVFFAIVLLVSLRPGQILTTIGKILNPIFLVCLGILLIVSFVNPMGSYTTMAPDAAYAANAGVQGFLEGYNTMDCIAGLAFGIVVVNVVKGLGIEKPEAIAAGTVKSGIFSGILMAIIYAAITLMGAQSRGMFALTENGSLALADISGHFFGTTGVILLTAIASFACLKTAIGLVISCSEAFVAMFPKGPSYKIWAVIFTVFSFGISNVGLTAIIAYAIPVLMFIYPLAITLIILAFTGKLFHHHKAVYISVTAFTLAAALFDFMAALPEGIINALHLTPLITFAQDHLPLFGISLGWLLPAGIGFLVGLIMMVLCKKRAA